jgi:hypothetical protein
MTTRQRGSVASRSASSRRSDDLVEENILGPPEIQAAELRALDGIGLKPLAPDRVEEQ